MDGDEVIYQIKSKTARGSILPLASVYLTNELNSCTFPLVVL
ncbi:hypothetical protein EUBHAL_01026 [Anaerobutyricum hallii DSM 3353]|uniref:Uncharacterized protein n=1 Tax=Anaerobutyricum hallii DSM 3353 TaxID=411469 RepID=C0EUE2_9FIRM|nr:hypothetical protein EUBHAL_01026 [Anaerobutyricum hallii DSM 3353]